MAQVAVPVRMESSQISPRYKWYVVAMLWFICFFNYADRQAISSVLPILEHDYGFDKRQLGWISAAFAYVYAFTAPLAGQVGDRFPRKPIILGGLYIWSAITGMTALCSKVWQFVLVRAAEGLGETFYFPASMSLVSDYHSPRTRSRAMSLHQTSVYAGTIGGALLAAWMAQHFGWQSPFILLGVLGIVLGLVLAAFIREPQRNEAQILERQLERLAESGTASAGIEGSEPDDSSLHPAATIPAMQFLAEALRTPTILVLMFAFLGANSVALVFLTWATTFIKEKFELTLVWSAVFGTVPIQLGSAAGSVIGGMLADRWSKRFLGGRIAVQATGVALAAPFVFLCGWTQELPLVIAAMTLFGISKGLYDANIWASLYDVVPVSRRGTAVGLMNMIGWFGGALGPTLVGYLVYFGMTMSTAISSTSIVYLIVAALLLSGAFIFSAADIRRAQQVS